MIQHYREQFLAEFTADKYVALRKELVRESGVDFDFRLSETPIFLSKGFKQQLFDASSEIIDQIKKIPPDDLIQAVPEAYKVPGAISNPHFLTIDFAIGISDSGGIVPQLIELQAFPSLYCFEAEVEYQFRKLYPILENFRQPIAKEDFVELFKEILIGDDNAENVILLEIFPEKQKTRVDFALTEKYLGIRTVCLTKIKKAGRKLYYDKNGERVEIKKIYNRVILDELERYSDLRTDFQLTDEVDVEWITHPNWFYMVSKVLLPKLQHAAVPKSYFAHEFPDDERTENFVLKPLFSFAGSGVNLHPTRDIIATLKQKEKYLLQRKVEYAPIFKDPDGGLSKAEIRLLYIWKKGEGTPRYVNNLVRMSKSEIINSGYNTNQVGTGSSIAFF